MSWSAVAGAGVGLVGSLLAPKGTGGGSMQAAPIVSPVTQKQAEDAYTSNQAALAQQQAFVEAARAQGGLQNQSNVYNQMAQVAAGQGPNPAQAALANATGANVANQAALMAGQRGASANTGLIARQAAQQGAGIQQNAAGQAAELQAQQSLAAITGMGNMANVQAGQEQSATQAMTASQLQEQQNLLNSISGANQANVNMQSNINEQNQKANALNDATANERFSGVMTGIGTGMQAGLKRPNTPSTPTPSTPTPSREPAAGSMPGWQDAANGGMINSANKSHLHSYFNDAPAMAHGGKVPVLLSPGEKVISPQQAVKGANPMAEGKTVPGKPKVGGAKNDYSNDTYKTSLPEGSIVVPRSVTKSKDADAKAMAFVQAVLAKKGKSLPKKDK